MERTVFVLAGHYSGKTINLNGHQFTNGVCEIWCPGDIVPFVKRSLASYQAYPERSYELELAQKRDAEYGIRDNSNTSTRDRESAKVSSLNQQAGSWSSPETTNERLPNANVDKRDAGSISKGNGREDARVSEITAEIDYRLKEVIESLDPDEEDHWTSEGLPSIEAVQAGYGPNVTREDITVSGENWNKEKALEKLASTASTKKGRGRPKKSEEVAG